MGKVVDTVKKAGGNLIGGATNAVTGALGLPSVGDLLGGPDLPSPRFTDINAGGLNVRQTGDVIDVSSGASRTAAVGGIRDVLNQRAEQLAQLRGQVQPGFGALTEARLGEIENARRRTIGNLRENLQRRRVLGSSFGQDVLSRAEAEFGQEAGQARARSFLEELDVQTQLIGQEFQARQSAIQATLDNLNLEANLGAQLAGAANSILENNAQAQAELASSQIAGLGQLAGTAIGAFGGPVGAAIGGTIGGSLGGRGQGGGSIAGGNAGAVSPSQLNFLP